METIKTYTHLNEELILLLVRQDHAFSMEGVLSQEEKLEHKHYQEELEIAIKNTRLKIANLIK